MKKYFLLKTILLFPIVVVSQNYCNYISEVQSYQRSARILVPNGNIDSKTFNLDSYTKFFYMLQLKPNSRYYLYYDFGGLGGEPHLYISLNNFNLNNYIDQLVPHKWWRFKYREQELRSLELYKFVLDSNYQARFNVTPVDSAAGYLQYLFLYQFGEQFALYWHSNYKEKYVICNQENITNIRKEYLESQSFSSNKDELDSLSKINPEIKIEMNKDSVNITWIECETHCGIYNRTYSICRNYPYVVRKTKENKIATFSPNFFY